MAEEMVLIPRVRYERLLKEENATAHSGERLNTKDTSKTEAKTEAKAEAKSEASDGDKADKSVTSTSPTEDVELVRKSPPGLREGKNANSKGSTKKAKLSIHSILEAIPSKSKEKAEKVLSHINSKGNSLITWNARGRLVYEGVVVNGTNIAELVYDLVSHRKQKSPGFSQMHKALVQIKLPKALLKAYTKTSKSSGKGNKREEPPGLENDVRGKWLSY